MQFAAGSQHLDLGRSGPSSPFGLSGFPSPQPSLHIGLGSREAWGNHESFTPKGIVWFLFFRLSA